MRRVETQQLLFRLWEINVTCTRKCLFKPDWKISVYLTVSSYRAKAYLLGLYSRLMSVLMRVQSTSDYTKATNAVRKGLYHFYILSHSNVAFPVLMYVLFLLFSTRVLKCTDTKIDLEQVLVLVSEL